MIAGLNAFANALSSDVDSYVTGLGFPIAWGNSPYTPPPRTAWVQAVLLLGDSDQVDNGGATRRYRYVGELRFSIHSVIETGEAESRTFFDSINGRYRGSARAGAQFETPRFVRVGEQGGWWRADVVCPFYADLLA